MYSLAHLNNVDSHLWHYNVAGAWPTHVLHTRPRAHHGGGCSSGCEGMTYWATHHLPPLVHHGHLTRLHLLVSSSCSGVNHVHYSAISGPTNTALAFTHLGPSSICASSLTCPGCGTMPAILGFCGIIPPIETVVPGGAAPPPGGTPCGRFPVVRRCCSWLIPPCC